MRKSNITLLPSGQPHNPLPKSAHLVPRSSSATWEGKEAVHPRLKISVYWGSSNLTAHVLNSTRLGGIWGVLMNYPPCWKCLPESLPWFRSNLWWLWASDTEFYENPYVCSTLLEKIQKRFGDSVRLQQLGVISEDNNYRSSSSSGSNSSSLLQELLIIPVLLQNSLL